MQLAIIPRVMPIAKPRAINMCITYLGYCVADFSMLQKVDFILDIFA